MPDLPIPGISCPSPSPSEPFWAARVTRKLSCLGGRLSDPKSYFPSLNLRKLHKHISYKPNARGFSYKPTFSSIQSAGLGIKNPKWSGSRCPQRPPSLIRTPKTLRLVSKTLGLPLTLLMLSNISTLFLKNTFLNVF